MRRQKFWSTGDPGEIQYGRLSLEVVREQMAAAGPAAHQLIGKRFAQLAFGSDGVFAAASGSEQELSHQRQRNQ